MNLPFGQIGQGGAKGGWPSLWNLLASQTLRLPRPSRSLRRAALANVGCEESQSRPICATETLLCIWFLRQRDSQSPYGLAELSGPTCRRRNARCRSRAVFPWANCSARSDRDEAEPFVGKRAGSARTVAQQGAKRRPQPWRRRFSAHLRHPAQPAPILAFFPRACPELSEWASTMLRTALRLRLPSSLPREWKTKRAAQRRPVRFY